MQSLALELPANLGGFRRIWNCGTCGDAEVARLRSENPAALKRVVDELSIVPEEFVTARVNDHPNPAAKRVGRDYVIAMPKPQDELLALRDWRNVIPEHRGELLSVARVAVKGAPGLGLVGMIGRGKTGLACAILNALRDWGIPGIVVNVESLMRNIQGTYTRGAAPLSSILDPLFRIPLLVLDDMDKVTGSRDQLLKLYGLINTRKESRLPLIFTSKLSPNEMIRGPLANVGSVGEDIIDRLVQMAPDWKQLENPSSYRLVRV